MRQSRNLPDVRREASNRDISRLQRNIQQMFNEFLSPLPDLWGYGRDLSELAFSPPVDVEETDDAYLLNFDLPGISKEDVQIELRDNQLVVSGERKEETEEKEERGNRLVKERYYGTFMRSFMLPSNVNADQVEAQYEDGVLWVRIPKAEAAKPKRVEIGGKKAQKAA